MYPHHFCSMFNVVIYLTWLVDWCYVLNHVSGVNYGTYRSRKILIFEGIIPISSIPYFCLEDLEREEKGYPSFCNFFFLFLELSKFTQGTKLFGLYRIIMDIHFLDSVEAQTWDYVELSIVFCPSKKLLKPSGDVRSLRKPLVLAQATSLASSKWLPI